MPLLLSSAPSCPSPSGGCNIRFTIWGLSCYNNRRRLCCEEQLAPALPACLPLPPSLQPGRLPSPPPAPSWPLPSVWCGLVLNSAHPGCDKYLSFGCHSEVSELDVWASHVCVWPAPVSAGFFPPYDPTGLCTCLEGCLLHASHQCPHWVGASVCEGCILKWWGLAATRGLNMEPPD